MNKDEIKALVESVVGEAILNVWQLGLALYKVESESGNFYIVNI